MTDEAITYDVFISYSRHDAASVELLATRLAHEGGVRVWFDRAELPPGFAWRDKIEQDMLHCATTLIVWGPHGLGAVQREERGLAYANRDARSDFRVINVLLPGASAPQASFLNVDTFIRFHSSVDESEIFANIVAAVKGEAPSSQLQVTLPDFPAPYQGMRDFGIDDAQFFFGRTSYVNDIIERLPHHPFLAILGASGSGKTSLLQAGFLARLQQDAFPGSALWPWLVVRPGPQPLRTLANGLARLQPHADLLTASDTHYGRLQANPAALATIVPMLVPAATRLILVLDRLEELFTLCRDEDERKQFLDAIVSLIDHPHAPSWVVTTMRADFYGHVARYPDIASQVVHHQLYLKPLAEADVAAVIEAPAAQVGAIFEKGLAMQVRTDVHARNEIALPLLQHTLDLLWRKRRGRWLTWDAYREIGGVAGALRYHADRVMEGLGPIKQDVARRIFMRMIWVEEDAGATLAGRRMDTSVLIEQFTEHETAENVLHGLADARLVVIRGESHDTASAELVHDTLPLYWERLRQWVQEDRVFLVWRQRLRADVEQWRLSHGDEGALLRGAPLAEAENWFQKRADEFSADETTLVAASIGLRKREADEEKRRQQREIDAARALAETAEARRIAEAQRAEEAEARSRDQSAAAQRQRILTRRAQRTAAVALALFSLALLLFLVADRHSTLSGVGRFVAMAELVRNQEPHRLPQSVLLAVEAMNQAQVGGVGSAWLPSPLLATIRWIETRLFGEMDLVAAGDVLRRGLTLLPLPIAPPPEQGWVNAVAMSRDGKQIFSALGHDVHIWNRHEQRRTATFAHQDSVVGIALSPDGKFLVTASRDNMVRMWEVQGTREILHFVHAPNLTAVALSEDGRVVVTTSDAEVRLWDAASGKEIRTLRHADRVVALALGTHTNYLATTSGPEVVVWDITSGARIVVLRGENAVTALAMHPEAALVATASLDRTIRLWDIPSGRTIARLQYGNPGAHVMLGEGIVASPPGEVRWLAFSSDGHLLATASTDLTARVWEIHDEREGGNKFLAEITRMIHSETVETVVFSPDSRMLVTAGGGGTRLWSITAGDELTHLTHTFSVTNVMFSAAGDRIATLTSENQAHVWELPSGKEVAKEPHHELVTALSETRKPTSALTAMIESLGSRGQAGQAPGVVPTTEEGIGSSDDGRYVAIRNDDGSVALWETGTRRKIGVISQERGINAVAFGPPGNNYLATAGTNGVARVVLWQPQDLTASACERIGRNFTEEEWHTYIGAEPYRKTCANLP